MAAPMKDFLKAFFILFLHVQLSLSFEDEFEGSRALSLEHSFDQGLDAVFTKRGMIAIKSVQSKKATFSQAAPLSTDDRTLLKEAATTNGIYRIRIPIRETDEGTVYVSTFTKACSIYEVGLADNIIISVDQSGEILGVSMATSKYCQGLAVPSSNLTDWKTRVDLSVTVNGPTPDTQSYIDKMKREEQQTTQGAKEDNRSFFAKYWMYIVPFVIMMFVMQSVDPNQGQGGGGGGGS